MRFAGSNPQLTSFMSQSPRFDQIGDTAQNAQSAKRQTAMATEAETAGAGLNSMAMIEKAKFDAEATRAQGQAQATATTWQGFGNMMGSIAGGVGSMNLGGGSGGFGSTGGSGSTFTPSSVSKYGDAVTNPMDSFRSAGITGPIYDFQSF